MEDRPNGPASAEQGGSEAESRSPEDARKQGSLPGSTGREQPEASQEQGGDPLFVDPNSEAAAPRSPATDPSAGKMADYNTGWDPYAPLSADSKGSPKPPSPDPGFTPNNLGSRGELGPPERPERKYTRWKPEWDKLLGTMSDDKLAKELGCSRLSVFLHRRILGIPVSNKIRWKDSWNRLLGTTSDGELSRRLGVSSGTVRKHRSAQGIAPRNTVGQDILAKRRSGIAEMTQEAIHHLRKAYPKASNIKIAQACGVSRQYVHQVLGNEGEQA